METCIQCVCTESQRERVQYLEGIIVIIMIIIKLTIKYTSCVMFFLTFFPSWFSGSQNPSPPVCDSTRKISANS